MYIYIKQIIYIGIEIFPNLSKEMYMQYVFVSNTNPSSKSKMCIYRYI